MKKIMFDDKFGLTDAVLQGRKTMTRRIIADKDEIDAMIYAQGSVEKKMEYLLSKSRYKVGEVVAVAQAYKDIEEYNPESYEDVMLDQGTICEASHPYSHLMKSGGWDNKMFVRADLMPHQIRITDVKVERLNDISDEDVYREGFRHEFVNNGWGNAAYHEEAILVYYDDKGRTKQIRDKEPKEAFSFLIDKVSGRGIWEANKLVFCYSFKLLK